MSKMKKMIAVILCLSFLVSLLPQQELKEVAAAESTEITTEGTNLYDMSEMAFPNPDATTYLTVEQIEIDEYSSAITVTGKKNENKTLIYWSDVLWEEEATYSISYYYKVEYNSNYQYFRFYPLARINGQQYSKDTAGCAFVGINHQPTQSSAWTKQEIIWTVPEKTETSSENTFGFNITLGSDDVIYLADIVIEKINPGFKGVKTVLSDEICLNMYLNDVAKSVDGLTATVDGVNTEVTESNDEKYVSIPLAAKEMADEVEVKLFQDGTQVAVKKYSVKEYAQTILNDSTKSSSWELVKAMLNYGAWAQKYFEYKTENLANSIVPQQDRYTDSSARERFQSYMTGETTLVQSGFDGYKYANGACTTYMEFKDESSPELGTIKTIKGKGKTDTTYAIWLMDDVTDNLTDTYLITYWIKTEKTEDSSQFCVYPSVRWYGDNNAGGWANESEKAEKVELTTGWQKVVWRWTPPENCTVSFHVNVRLQLDAGDSISIAGFKLERAEHTAGIGDYQPTVESPLSSFLGYTLVLKDTTSVRLYFSEKPEGATIDADSASITKKGERYYIEIPDVKAGDLNKPYNIIVTDTGGTMTIQNFSVLSAATAAIESTTMNANLKDLCIALVLYAEAAQ